MEKCGLGQEGDILAELAVDSLKWNYVVSVSEASVNGLSLSLRNWEGNKMLFKKIAYPKF